MKKTLSIILVIVMLMALVPAAFAAGDFISASSTSIEINKTSTIYVDNSKLTDTPDAVIWSVSGEGVSLSGTDITGATLNAGSTACTATVTAVAKKGETILDTATCTVTITAPTTYSVTVETVTGGTASASPATAAEGTKITLSGTAAAGYRLDGFNSSDVTIASDYSFSMPAKNVTVTPVWTRIYAVTVASVTGGTVTADKTEAAEAETVTLTVSPSTGYHLTGIKVNDNTITGTTFAMPAAAATVTPEFAPNTYTVKFHANGGTGEDKTQTFTFNAAQALTANAYTRTGYTFLGWSTNSAAATANYGDKESVLNLTSTDGGVVDLYAIWTPSTTYYTVTMGKYSGANLGRAYWSLDQKNWYEVTNEYSNKVNAGTTLYFKMDPYKGYYRHPYVVNANGSYYSPGYGQTFSVVINENKTVKLNFSQYVPTGDAGVWGYVVTMLASAGTVAGVYFGTKKKK